MPDVNLYTYHRFTSVDRCNARRHYRHYREVLTPSKARIVTMRWIDQLAADCAYVDSFDMDGGE